jgi:hypothetical protein
MPHTALMAIAAVCLMTTTAFAQDLPTPNITTQDEPTQGAPVSARPKQPLWEAGLFGLGVTLPAYPGSNEHVSRALGLPYLI